MNNMEDLMKVPDSVIIKSLQEEVKALRKKNHEICVKAKEREEHWKAHTDCLTEKIVELQRDDSDEEKKAIRREAKAMKKANEDYSNLLEQYNHLREKYEQMKEQVQYLKDELEGNFFRYWDKDYKYKLDVRDFWTNSQRKWYVHIDNDVCNTIGSGEFDYVHELQNLVRVITGRDLPITKEMLYE